MFEPHAAEAVFQELVQEAKVPVVFGERLDLERGVVKQGPQIVRIVMESGRTLRRTRVHRRQLRRRPDGQGGRVLHGRAASPTPAMANGSTACSPTASTNATTSTTSSWPRSMPYVQRGDPASGLLPSVHDGGPGPRGRRRPSHPGLLLPHLPDRPARQPGAHRQAHGLRSAALRAAAPLLRGRIRRHSRRSAPPAQPQGAVARCLSAQPQDRQQQRPRRVGRQHGHELRLSRRRLRHAGEDHRGSPGVPAGALLDAGPQSARSRGRAPRNGPLGTGQGRIHRQRPLAAPALRARGAAHDRPTT